MRLKIAILIVVASIGAFAWWASFEPKLSEADALRIAGVAILERKIDLSGYERPIVKFEVAGGRRIWTVHYPGKSRSIGDFFAITIDDATGKATFSGGA